MEYLIFSRKMSLPSAIFSSILGIGVDLVDSRRIEKALLRHPNCFVRRIFTDQERTHADAQKKPVLSYAKRFAAKEAFAKAAGLGIGRVIGWKDVETVSQPSGQPTLIVSTRCQMALTNLWQQNFSTMVSLSDEPPYAQAFVVIVGCPGQDYFQGLTQKGLTLRASDSDSLPEAPCSQEFHCGGL